MATGQHDSIEAKIRSEAEKVQRWLSKNAAAGVNFAEPTLLLRYTGIYVAAQRERQWYEEDRKQVEAYLRDAGNTAKARQQIHESVKAVLIKAEKTHQVAKKVSNSQLEAHLHIERRLMEVQHLLTGLASDTCIQSSFEEEKRKLIASQRRGAWWRREPLSTRVIVQWHAFVANDDPNSRDNIYGLAWYWNLTKAEGKEEFERDLWRKIKRIRRSDGGTQIPCTPWGGAEIWRQCPKVGNRGKNNQEAQEKPND